MDSTVPLRVRLPWSSLKDVFYVTPGFRDIYKFSLRYTYHNLDGYQYIKQYVIY